MTTNTKCKNRGRHFTIDKKEFVNHLKSKQERNPCVVASSHLLAIVLVMDVQTIKE